MIRQIGDPDVALLATLSSALEADYASDLLPWEGSPFAWIKTRPSRQVGAIGERLVAGWCAARDFDVVRSPNSDADRVIGGKRCEIKFSTLWRSGVYKFQQLRDQEYDLAILLGVSPFDASCWVVQKQDLIGRRGTPGGPTPQHGGSTGRDTLWLSFPALNPPDWLRACGGTLREAAEVLHALTSGS